MDPPLETSGKYGKCVFADCLDIFKELKPHQADGFYDLCFTDTLWGHNYEKNAQKPMGINKKATKQNRIPYPDPWDPEFHKTWFPAVQKLTNAQVVCVGKKHVNWWVKEFDPLGMVPIVYRNGQGSTAISRYSGHMMYLCFGKEQWWKQHKHHRDFVEQAVYPTYIHNGFLRDDENEEIAVHPSPKDFETWYMMIKDLKPRSLLDPFAGSCVIGEVAEALGIPWLAMELMEEYYLHAKFRIHKGMLYRDQNRPTRNQTLTEMI